MSWYRRCRHYDSANRRCKLRYGHCNDHQWKPTFWEYLAGFRYHGCKGNER